MVPVCGHTHTPAPEANAFQQRSGINDSAFLRVHSPGGLRVNCDLSVHRRSSTSSGGGWTAGDDWKPFLSPQPAAWIPEQDLDQWPFRTVASYLSRAQILSLQDQRRDTRRGGSQRWFWGISTVSHDSGFLKSKSGNNLYYLKNKMTRDQLQIIII